MRARHALMPAVVLGLGLVLTGNPTLAHALDALDASVATSALQDKGTAAPAADTVVPDANQYEYQKDGLSAFCHFGPNTFNEIEWGENYGNRAPSEIFQLREGFDAETFVKTLKESGFTKLIITAKHHDGFCIWPSEYTDYDAGEAGYKGDILEEISTACTKYDIDMGLYLSPWDIHDKSYGYKDADGNALVGGNGQPLNGMTWDEVYEKDAFDYNEYYDNQLREILGNKKYGNNGRFKEVWMDGAKGSGANAQNYDFQRWFTTIQSLQGKAAGYDADCLLFGAESYTTVQWIGNENGLAGDNTWAKAKTNREANTINANKKGSYNIGFADGNQWIVPEADARITSGWFWGNNKKTPKSLTDLGNMYFNSVGHNSVLLLNIPPNNKGKIDDAILQRTREFGANIKSTFSKNLAEGATVKASSVRGGDSAYSPANVVDGLSRSDTEAGDTYWTTDDGTTTGTLVLDLDGTKTFDVVSIEESIEFGQRIDGYKIEYRRDGGSWTVFEEGETIGSKRLARKSPVRADEVRVTVKSRSGAPMISEIGLYKASEAFEVGTGVPESMEVKGIKTGGWTRTGTWTDENGTQYLNREHAYSSKQGNKAELTFTGSKIYLLGTIDPNHGKMTVQIDGGEAKTVETKGSPRAVNQILYTSDDLAYGEHKVTVTVAENRAVGLVGAYVLDNGGKGVVEVGETSVTMGEDATYELALHRVGGSTGELNVLVEPNPGTAIQDDFDTTPQTVHFADGQTEAKVPIKTRRNTNKTGSQQFTVEISNADGDEAIGGLKTRVTVTINDTEAYGRSELTALVRECGALDESLYAGGWAAFARALSAAEEMVGNEDATDSDVAEAYLALVAARDALELRGAYTEEDPFVFPSEVGASKTLEAEFATLHNTGGDSERWKLEVASGDWASNGKFVNSLNKDDSITIPFDAPVAGTYTVKATYRSGSNENKLVWSTDDGSEGVVDAGEKVAGNDSASVTKTVEFEMTVSAAGTGTLRFTGPEKGSPQLDKLEITAKTVAPAPVQQVLIVATADAVGGKISPSGILQGEVGDSVTFTITPDEGYEIADVTVDGKSVGVVSSYAFENVTEDHRIHASFKKAEKPVEVDRKALKDAIAAAGKVELDGYTEESVAAFKEAREALVAAAQAVLDDADATQEAVDKAATDLKAGIAEAQKALVKEEVVDPDPDPEPGPEPDPDPEPTPDPDKPGKGDEDVDKGDDKGEDKGDDKPTTPAKPTTPSKPGKSEAELPQTGDVAGIVSAALSALGVSGLGAAAIARRRRK